MLRKKTNGLRHLKKNKLNDLNMICMHLYACAKERLLAANLDPLVLIDVDDLFRHLAPGCELQSAPCVRILLGKLLVKVVVIVDQLLDSVLR